MYCLCSSYLFPFLNLVGSTGFCCQLNSPVPIPVIPNKACGNLGCVMYLQGILFAIIFWDPRHGVLYHYISPKLLLFIYSLMWLLLGLSSFCYFRVWALQLNPNITENILNLFLHKERKGNRQGGMDRTQREGDERKWIKQSTLGAKLVQKARTLETCCKMTEDEQAKTNFNRYFKYKMENSQ